MLNFKSAEDVMSLSEFRNNLSACVEKSRTTGRPLLLTQNGRTAGVFLAAAAWDALQQELETKETYEDLLVAEGEADRGEVISIEDFEKQIRERRTKEHRRKKSKTGKLASRSRPSKFCRSGIH